METAQYQNYDRDSLWRTTLPSQSGARAGCCSPVMQTNLGISLLFATLFAAIVGAAALAGHFYPNVNVIGQLHQSLGELGTFITLGGGVVMTAVFALALMYCCRKQNKYIRETNEYQTKLQKHDRSEREMYETRGDRGTGADSSSPEYKGQKSYFKREKFEEE